MVATKQRSSDKWYYHDVVKIVIFLIGGGITGFGTSSYVAPALDNQVIRDKVLVNEQRINKQVEQFIEYKLTRDRQEELKDALLNTKLDAMKTELETIRTLITKIK